MPTNDPNDSMWRRSTTRRLLAWCCRRRTLQILCFLLAALVTLGALMLATYNWRSGRAWQYCRQSLLGKGEVLDPKAFIPPPVPDDQNFAMTPFLAPLFDFSRPTPDQPVVWRDTNAHRRVSEFAKDFPSARVRASRVKGQVMDLADWLATHNRARLGRSAATNAPPEDRPSGDRAETARAVVKAIQEYEPVLAELRAASQRPHARFHVQYDIENPWGILLPHLAVIRRVASILTVRASAFLALGQAQPAYDDLLLILSLADSMKTEPLVISKLVRVACFQLAAQVIWEGLAAHQWSPQQLQALQDRLAGLQLLPEMRQSLRAERAFNVAFLEILRDDPAKRRYLAYMGDTGGGTPSPFFLRLIPRGWFNYELRSYAQFFQDTLATGQPRDLIDPAAQETNSKRFEALSGPPWEQLWHHRIISRIMIPALTQIHRRVGYAQDTMSQAALACALERFRLAQGAYPEKLEALVPAYINSVPPDIIQNQVFRYRRTGDAAYVLYSDGWNQQDEGGQTVFRSMKGTEIDTAKGDWAWRL